MRHALFAGAALGAFLIAAPRPGEAAPMIVSTTASNSVIGAGVQGWVEATWYLLAAADTVIDVYYLGGESSANNTFKLNSFTTGPYSGNTGLSSLFGGSTAPLLVGDSLTSPGLLNFAFLTDFGVGGTVTNLDNPAPPATPRFFSFVITCGAMTPIADCAWSGGSTATGGNTLLLAFDDGGGRVSPDLDDDDLVIVLRISNGGFTIPVPEPASLALLGAGLLGLGFASRRRRSA